MAGTLTRYERDTVQRMLECGASCEQIVRGLGGSPSMASFEALEGGLLRRLWFILRRLLSSDSHLV